MCEYKFVHLYLNEYILVYIYTVQCLTNDEFKFIHLYLSQYHIMMLQIFRHQSLVNRNIGKEKNAKVVCFFVHQLSHPNYLLHLQFK